MKKKHSLLFVLFVLLLSFAFVITGCGGDLTDDIINVITSNSINSVETVRPSASSVSTEFSSVQNSTGSSELPNYSTANPTSEGQKSSRPIPSVSASTPPVSTVTPIIGVSGQLPYASNTVLRMATGYQKSNQGITFDDTDIKDENGITLSDGVTYKVGDLKPTWAEVQKRLNINFEDKWTGAGSAEKEFTKWESENKLGEVDMISGSQAKLQVAGAQGKVINIAEYLDKMPNFKAFLDANPIVRLSITGSIQGTNKGAIYYSPYYDGVNDIERMPLMRVDFVEKLLNGAGQFTAAESKSVNTSYYTPYMPTTGSIEVEVGNPKASGVEIITKDYSQYGNIIANMNAESSLTGVQAVNMLREYIDKTYSGYYGTNRADLFIGQNAAWDADELVALLRCVVANPQTLNGTDSIEGFYCREDFNLQRTVDAFRFAGSLFGVRGLESRQEYLYFDSNGELHDARQELDTYLALEKMNALKQEGLISSAYNDTTKQIAKSDEYLKNDSGFMSYDYSQTQTLYNATKLDNAAGEKYMAVITPVAKWDDGDSATPDYFRFTESWRSVKTDGWALSKAGIGNDVNKLNAALSLIDYAYSLEGQILLSYGPDAFIKVKNANATTIEEKYQTFNFNGEQWPEISEGCKEDLKKYTAGNYSNFARHFLGSTLSFAKSQAFEIQCTHEVGKEGVLKVSNAVGFGVIKHPELDVCENMWYTSIPTIIPTTDQQNSIINGLTELSSNGKFSQAKGGTSLFCSLIAGGYTDAAFAGTGITDGATAVTTVSSSWSGTTYLVVKTVAWNSLEAYYNEID